MKNDIPKPATRSNSEARAIGEIIKYATAADIRENPLKIPIKDLMAQLRSQSPEMMRHHKISRLKFAALCSAIGQASSTKGCDGSPAFAISQDILQQVDERLKPGWFQRQVDGEIQNLDQARARLKDFKRPGDSEFNAQCRFLHFIILTEFSGSNNLQEQQAIQAVMS